MPKRAGYVERWQTLTVVTQTYPIEPGQRVFAVVTTNRWQSAQEYEFSYDFPVGNNSQWYRILGPFPPGTEVDFYIRAEGSGGTRFDNNNWQDYGYVSRWSPTRRDGAILQWFQTDYRAILQRLPEVARAGYSALYLPAPQKSGGGGFSAGYNPFDRFDLGDRLQKGTVRTQYGTTQELIELIAAAKRFDIEVYCDLVLNHNDNRASTAINRYPDMIPEDFHIRSSSDTGNSEINFNTETSFSFGMLNHDLVGLVDVAHEDGNNTQTGAFNLPSYASFNSATKPTFVRNPLTPQYYPSQNPVSEDVRQFLRRWCWWLADVIGFDGFRIDAVKHTPPSFFQRLQGQPGSSTTPGDLMPSIYQAAPHAYVLGEVYSSVNYELREYAKTGMQVLDFPLKFRLNDVFNSQGFGNLGAAFSNGYSVDGSTGLPFEHGGLGQNVGVSFVQSHDDGPPQSNNLAHAFILTRSGRPKVYYDGNNIEPNNWSHFPRPGRYDSLGQGGDLLLRMLDAKRRFARGSVVNRSVSPQLYVYERQVDGKGTLLVGLNIRGDIGGALTTNVQTAFAPGQILRDLSGQRPNVTVGSDSRVTITVPANSDAASTNNARGYVFYAPIAPEPIADVAPIAIAYPGGASLPIESVPTPGGQYASPGSFETVVVELDKIDLTVRATALGHNAVVKLNDGKPMAGRATLINTPEGLSDGFVVMDKLANGHFRLSGIDLSNLSDGRHLLRVRVFADTPGRPPIFNEFQLVLTLRRGLGRDQLIDGDLAEFGAPLSSQTRNPSSNLNRLDALYVSNDDQNLYLGLAGRVDTAETLTNGFALWMDLDPGTGTGLRDLSKLDDDSGPAPRLLSNSRITLPTHFGAEFGLGVFRHSRLGSSPEDGLAGQPILPPSVGAQAGLYAVQDAVTQVLSPRRSAIAFQPRANRADPPRGAEVAVPLTELYSSGIAPNARIGFVGMLLTTGESGTTLLSTDPLRATLGGRPAPAAWLSNQILPLQPNVPTDLGTGPVTLLMSVSYDLTYAQGPSGMALNARPQPAPVGANVTAWRVTVTNTSSQSLSGPITILVQVPPGVTVQDAWSTSLRQPGVPVIRLQPGPLAPGASTSTIVRFESTSAFKPVFSPRAGPGIL